MKEIHHEVIRPTQRSPCVGCRNEKESKARCIEGCEKIKVYQDAIHELERKGVVPHEIGRDYDPTEDVCAPRVGTKKHDPALFDMQYTVRPPQVEEKLPQKEKEKEMSLTGILTIAGAVLTIHELFMRTLKSLPPGQTFRIHDLYKMMDEQVKDGSPNISTIQAYIKHAVDAGLPIEKERAEDKHGNPYIYKITEGDWPPPDVGYSEVMRMAKAKTKKETNAQWSLRKIRELYEEDPPKFEDPPRPQEEWDGRVEIGPNAPNFKLVPEMKPPPPIPKNLIKVTIEYQGEVEEFYKVLEQFKGR